MTESVAVPFGAAGSYSETELFAEVTALLKYIARHYQRQDLATFVDLKIEDREASLRIYSTDVPEDAGPEYDPQEIDELEFSCHIFDAEVCIDQRYWKASQRDECLGYVMQGALANLNEIEQRHLLTAFMAAPRLPRVEPGARP